MATFVSDDESLKRRCYNFIDDDREMLKSATIDSRITIMVKNDQNQDVKLTFRVTRNVELGTMQHWLYGQLLEWPSDFYFQIEIKMYKDRPHLDTIEVYPQAPPL